MTDEATAVRCKKCGADMRETCGADFRAYECVACHFVLIESFAVAGDPVTD
jgi:hypothetical protein